MTPTDPQLAIAAAEAGAAVVRSRYGAPLARVHKSPTDFATEADLEAEAAILQVLRAARPQDSLLGEESGHQGPEGATRTWLVDPLCGTLNFAVQTPLASVNVALRHGREVTAAASADPWADEVFWTDGQRAHVRRGGVDEPLVPSAESRLVDLNLDGDPAHVDRMRTVQLLAQRRFAEQFRPRVMSTTLALAWVAGGRRAAYVTEGDLRDSVHFASGIALCRAAGCVVTGIDGQPLHTGAGGLVAAADQQTHAALMAVLRAQTARR